MNKGQLLNLWLLGQDTEHHVAFDGWKCDCVNVRLKVLIKHKCIENRHLHECVWKWVNEAYNDTDLKLSRKALYKHQTQQM